MMLGRHTKHISTEKALISGHVQMESGKKRGKYDHLIEMIDDTQSEQFIYQTLEMLAKVKGCKERGDIQGCKEVFEKIKESVFDIEKQIDPILKQKATNLVIENGLSVHDIHH